MALAQAHKKYADARIAYEIAKLLKKKKPNTKTAEKASYKATFAKDRKLRPGSPNGWYTATAKNVNKVIRSEVKKGVKAIYSDLKKRGKLASLETLGTGVMAASIFAIAAATPEAEQQPSVYSRRTMFTVLAGGAFALAFPTVALADNRAYIKEIKGAARGYVNGKSKAISNGLGAGIRG